MKKIFCFHLLLLSLPFISSASRLDSLLNEYKKAKDHHKPAIGAMLAHEYRFSNPDSGIYYGKAAIALAEKCNVSEKIKGTCYLNLGTVYSTKSEYTEALKYLLRATKIFEAINDSVSVAPCYNGIAVIYDWLNNNSKALEYYQKALLIFEKTQNKRGVGVSLSNIGTLYAEEKKFDEAIVYHERAFKMDSTLNNSEGMAANLVNMATIYMAQNTKHNKAIFYLEAALKICEADNFIVGIGLCLQNIAACYFNMQDYPMTIRYAEKALRASTETNALLDMAVAHEYLAKSYQHLNKFEKALSHYIEFKNLKDSVFNAENSRQMGDMKTQYEVDKKANELNLIAKEKEVRNQEEMHRQKIIRNFILTLVLIFAGIGLYVYRAYKQKRLANLLLSKQKDEIEFQKEIIEEKSKAVTDSINYAKRIQYSLLAHDDLLAQHLRDYFVLFIPKDIVSGDFYWATKRGNSFYIACCDSTGHGVPGAFMSLLNISFLNEAINEKFMEEPHVILNHVRDRLVQNLSGSKDGMDATLVRIEQVNGTSRITYAAANNEPILIRKGNSMDMAKDKMPVGKGENEGSFTTHSMEYDKGDILYLYTDGIVDQFGGEDRKKLMRKNFKKLLLDNCALKMDEQQHFFTNFVREWRGELKQIDDVTLIGIRL